MKVRDLWVSVYYQPLNALQLSLSGSYVYNWRRQDQFVENIPQQHATRSIVGQVKQETLRFTGRLSYNITPDLTLQYYGQPFITRPRYNQFANVTDPGAKRYEDRFHVFDASEISFSNGEYRVQESANGMPGYSFSKPDFNFVQFRSNLIARWEYKAGSELYLVWSQGNTADASADLSSPLARSLWDYAFADQSRHSFLIKATYRFLK